MINLRVGEPVILEDLLDKKELRAHEIQRLQSEHPEAVVLSYKLNMMGPIKNNESIQWIFQQGLDQLPPKPLYTKIEMDLVTGPEALFVYDQERINFKKNMIQIEEQHPLGRLFDLDVNLVKRTDFQAQARKCLICEDDAVVCGRSRKHSIDELLDAIELMVINLYNKDIN